MASSEAGAARLIGSLGLEPHPEGGWYRETWREASAGNRRDHATAIYFLLEAGQRSHWHRVDAAELWLFHSGAPVALRRAPSADGPVEALVLGCDVAAGELPQQLIPAGWWQAADASHGWALMSCVVAPGFDFTGFELAPSGWSPGAR